MRFSARVASFSLPIASLLELLPRLAARPYSAASDAANRRVRLCYSLMTFPVAEGRRYARAGLASEWMTKLKLGDRVKVRLVTFR